MEVVVAEKAVVVDVPVRPVAALARGLADVAAALVLGQSLAVAPSLVIGHAPSQSRWPKTRVPDLGLCKYKHTTNALK